MHGRAITVLQFHLILPAVCNSLFGFDGFNFFACKCISIFFIINELSLFSFDQDEIDRYGQILHLF